MHYMLWWGKLHWKVDYYDSRKKIKGNSKMWLNSLRGIYIVY